MAAVGVMLISAAATAQVQIEPRSSADSETAVLGQLVEENLSSSLPERAQLNVRVTLGVQAFEDAIATRDDRPIVAAFLTSTEFEIASSAQDRAGITAVFSNPDPQDQVTLARLLLGRSSVGVFDTPAAHHLVERISDRTVRRIEASSDQRIDSLLRSAESLDAIVALPDSSILNRSTINHVIRSLYQRRKVLIGYSETLTRAGSLASVYVPPDAEAQRIVQVLREYADTGEMPAPAFVVDVDVAINERLARSLNIPVPERSRLLDDIRSRRR